MTDCCFPSGVSVRLTHILFLQKEHLVDDALTNAYIKHSTAVKQYQMARTQLQNISKGSLLWSIWAHNVVMWEVRERSNSAHAGLLTRLYVSVHISIVTACQLLFSSCFA
jgi:hypothetical protein